MANVVEQKDVQQNAVQTNSYVTVIPVEYPSNRVYNGQTPEYIVEQYSDYSSRALQDDYIQTEEVSSNPSGLYSVSQRIQSGTSSYSTVCPPEPFNNNNDQGHCSTSTSAAMKAEWSRDRSLDNVNKEVESEASNNEKQLSEATATSAGNIPGTSSSQAESFQGPTIPMCIYLRDKIAVMLEIDDTPSATVEILCSAIINSEELGLNKQISSQIFTIWMISNLLELQLKPSHKPYEVRKSWKSLVSKFSHGSSSKQERDEPMVYFQRNVFFPQQLEEKIKDQRILELLYEEAKHNILEGRYPCEVGHYIMLGGIQARIELGSYNPQVHSTDYFREEQCKYLPIHVRKSSTWTWLPISSKNSAEVRLLEQFKRIPTSATNRKLMRKYLEFCWSLPFYGSAFFEGQIEQPVRGLTSLITRQDIPVLVAINAKAVFIIDDTECTVLLGLRYEEFSWDYARPSKEHDPNCFPCLFLQFLVVENGIRVSKILQVFSRQASLMDTLISGFVQQIKEKASDEADRPYMNQVIGEDTHAPITIANPQHPLTNLPSLTNKLSRLTLATFDEDGHCIGQMGSWSFSY